VLTSAVPILPARDLDEAVAFYGRLGFRPVGRHPDYALLLRDGAELQPWLCADRHIAENTACYLRVDDLHALHRELAAAEPGRMTAPHGKPWGLAEFEGWDPSGNLLRFGQAPPSGGARSPPLRAPR
jgi:catechol 2,3-dioxygenase-like lactoylglutathione lyase family enzyme